MFKIAGSRFRRSIQFRAISIATTAAIVALTGAASVSMAGSKERMRARPDFPAGPEASVTPGSTCQHPDEYRYPEKIAYCERHVSQQVKKQVFARYDSEFGYHVQAMHRQDFKIDHYIPLCAGGSNEFNNLWPQHKTIFVLTDPLEQVACEKMAAGLLRQKDAIEMIKRAKSDLSQVDEILAEVEAL